jgi:hypothetical protein
MDRAQGREAVNLDGTWNFATDPDNRGETEKWFEPNTKLPTMPLPGYAPSANGTIQVPGIWDNQGYGTETPKVRHNFIGKGWYKRQVEIPKTWAGQRVFLSITGVSRSAKAWINDAYLGEHVGYVSAFEWDITDHITPGQPATITIQVDSKQHWEVDAMYSASALADYMDVPWGGIWGHVSLEARPQAWLNDLFVQTDVPSSSCTVSATLNGKAELADGAKLEVFDKNGKLVAETTSSNTKLAAGQTVALKAPVPNAELWTPDTPTLYRAKLTLLKGKDVVDSSESRFGIRQFSADGPNLLLNGKRFFLRGYGDDHIYPEQMAMPSDKALYVARLKLIKSYGFNHVRHHSSMMSPEYYEACDEVGIISTAEFAICYYIYLPKVGATWIANVKPGTDPALALDTYKREWTGAIKRHRNHPSILCWVRGNELYEEMTMCKEFAEIAKELDPTRWYVDTDGYYAQQYNKDRETLPIQFLQFAEWENPIDNVAKYQTKKPIKPMISHETSNYVAFSRPDLVDQFQHNIKPFWLTPGKEKLEKLGLSQEADLWAEKSERLYTLLQKHNYESLRTNPFLSGYHWWLFQDYWTSSNGIVDHYFRQKSITQKDILRFNNDVVLLQSGLERTYRGKNRLNVKLSVSNFSNAPLSGRLLWEVKLGDQSLIRKEQALSQVPQGDVTEAVQIDMELPDMASPAPIKITAELQSGDKQFNNDWSSWLYPAVIRPKAFTAPVFATETYLEKLADWGVQPIPAEGELNSHAVYVIDSLFDHRVIEAMDRGASVLLLGGAEQILPSRPVTYKTTWWKAGDNVAQNHCGTFIYDHPVTHDMANDRWCDAAWFNLIEGSTKYVVEGTPAKPNTIIRALPSMMLIEDTALLFEVGVGKGRIIVSGLNHQQAKDRPENQWILARMLDYAETFSQPKTQWPTSLFSLAYDAPEGCLPGFGRLITTKGESTAWFSYREDRAQTYVCRQSEPGHNVTWETTPVPTNLSADSVTFVFAGGLGFNSQPKTDGFALDINGKEAIRFNLPPPDHWESADKRVNLRFETKRTVTEDSFGLFYLKIPRDMLTPGKTCQLTVRSLGSGSQRWFGLIPYTNTKQ